MMAVENKQSFWNHLGSIVEIGIRNGDLRLSEKLFSLTFATEKVTKGSHRII